MSSLFSMVDECIDWQVTHVGQHTKWITMSLFWLHITATDQWAFQNLIEQFFIRPLFVHQVWKIETLNMPKQIPNVIWIQIVAMREAGLKFKQISDQVGYSIGTCSIVVRNHKEQLPTSPQRHAGKTKTECARWKTNSENSWEGQKDEMQKTNSFVQQF